MSAPNLIRLPPHSITLVGAINPAILVPAWMQRFVEVLQGQVLQTMLPDPPGSPIFYASADGTIWWWASSDRFVVHGPPEATGEIAAKVLEQLPHTPLRAAGVNFLFEAPVRRDRTLPWRTETAAERLTKIAGGPPGELSVSQSVFRSAGARLTIRVMWAGIDTEAFVDLNYHYEARGPEGPERAAELADRVRAARDLARDAARIKEELTNG